MALLYAGCGSFQGQDSTAVSALTITVKGDFAGGTIVSQPAGIDCGTTCSTIFNTGTMVTLTASLTDSTDFVGWDGDCTGNSPTCSLAVDKVKNVGATFRSKINRANLEVSLGGGGGGLVSSVPFGIQCGNSCTGGFDKGTMVTLTATPDSTSIFTGWTGACTSSARTCVVTLSADMQVTANFANPASCEQIRADAPTSGDGNRKLFVGGNKTKPWDAFCLMSVIPAVTYLPLANVAAAQNYSQFSAGGSATGTTVKTNYTKLQIDPATFAVNTNDKRYATTTGGPLTTGGTSVTAMPYATAMGCQNGTANGAANIDLTGTQFAVATGALALGGTAPTGTTTPAPNDQLRVFALTGGGNCGFNAPKGATAPYNNGGVVLNLVYFP